VFAKKARHYQVVLETEVKQQYSQYDHASDLQTLPARRLSLGICMPACLRQRDPEFAGKSSCRGYDSAAEGSGTCQVAVITISRLASCVTREEVGPQVLLVRTSSCFCQESHIRHAPDVLLFISCHIEHDLNAPLFISCEYPQVNRQFLVC
jgi:hypothetical protein